MPSSTSSTAAAGARPECESRVGFTGVGWLHARRGSISSFIPFLTVEVGRPVIDATGLTGTYDIDIKWSPDIGPGVSRLTDDAPQAGDGMSFFTALKDQLGLKLRSAQAESEVLVVEKAEKPSSN